MIIRGGARVVVFCESFYGGEGGTFDKYIIFGCLSYSNRWSHVQILRVFCSDQLPKYCRCISMKCTCILSEFHSHYSQIQRLIFKISTSENINKSMKECEEVGDNRNMNI